MKKMPSLFIRDHLGDKKVVDEVNPKSAWVFAGEGFASRKRDGMAVLVEGGLVFKRYDAKSGRTPPSGFVPAQPEPDEVSGHWPGWVPATGPDSKFINQAIEWARSNLFSGGDVPDGTYEACGPSIGTRHGANPEGLSEHRLFVHGAEALPDAPRDFAGLIEYLKCSSMEGIVWRHPDGRMAKIKKNDFAAIAPAALARKVSKP